MFSLIITLISVALVVSLLIATIFYLSGETLGKANTETQTARLLSESGQIQAAIEMYRAAHTGDLPGSLEDLTVDGEYLRQLPRGAWRSNVAYIQTAMPDIDENVCLAFNLKKGIPFVPSCTDPAFRDVVMCCDSTPE